MRKKFWVIVNEVIRKTDIVLEILDARMPEITRNMVLEDRIRSYEKTLVIVFNKCDLVSKKTVMNMKKEYKDNCIFLSTKEFTGIKSLLKIIKNNARKDQKFIRVGVIGYPNTGKSSIINILSRKGRARTSPQSGYTRGVQLIRGKSNLMLFDTPGVIKFKEDDEVRLGLVSARDPSKLENPERVALELIGLFVKNNKEAIETVYNIKVGRNKVKVLKDIGEEMKMLKKGGVVDERRAAIRVLYDWHKGNLRL